MDYKNVSVAEYFELLFRMKNERMSHEGSCIIGLLLIRSP